MDEELRRAIYEIRDSLAEIRDFFRRQKSIHESAGNQCQSAEEIFKMATGKSMKDLMESLARGGK